MWLLYNQTNEKKPCILYLINLVCPIHATHDFASQTKRVLSIQRNFKTFHFVEFYMAKTHTYRGLNLHLYNVFFIEVEKKNHDHALDMLCPRGCKKKNHRCKLLFLAYTYKSPAARRFIHLINLQLRVQISCDKKELWALRIFYSFKNCNYCRF